MQCAPHAVLAMWATKHSLSNIEVPGQVSTSIMEILKDLECMEICPKPCGHVGREPSAAKAGEMLQGEPVPGSIACESEDTLLNRIRTTPSMHELKLSLEELSRVGIAQLAQAIAHNKSIETVNDIDLFPLRQESEIYSVDLCDSILTDYDGILVAELVKLNSAVIEVKFHSESPFVVKDLTKCGERRIVDLSSCQFDPPSCQFFKSLIPLGSQLDKLVLTGCNIDDSCAHIIARAIEGVKVQALDLSSNKLLHKGCLEIMKAAARTEVQTLDLRGSCLLSTQEELDAMLTHFKGAKSLKQMNGFDLDLSKRFGLSRVVDFTAQGMDGGFIALLLDSIVAIPGITRLLLGGCNLTDCMEVFTSSLCALLPNLTELKELSLPRNGLTDAFVVTLAEVLPTVHLEKLNLSGNQIGKAMVPLARAIVKSSSLCKIDLTDNDTTEARSKQFLTALDETDRLLEINQIALNSPSKRETPSRAELKKFDYLTVATALSSKSHTSELILHSCDVNCARAAFMGKLLTGNDSLEKLDLSHNILCTDGFRALSDGISSHSKLKDLNLAHNRLTDESMKALTKLLTAPIEVLNLSENAFGPVAVLELTKGVRNCNTLKRLDISGNSIHNEGFETLCEALPLSQVQVLKARQIGISTGKRLGQLISSCDNIVSLDIAKNGMGSSCAHIVCGLLVNTSVTQLILQGNRIGDTITNLLAKSLMKNTSVTKVSLRGNRIKDKGAQALAEMLKRNSTLQGLDLASNYIGELGGLSLASALTSSPGLRSVDVRCNNFSKAIIEKLSISWEANSQLQILRLYNFTNPSNEEDGLYYEGSECSSTLVTTEGSSTTSSGFTQRISLLSSFGERALSGKTSEGPARSVGGFSSKSSTWKTKTPRSAVSVHSVKSNVSTSQSNLRRLVSISRASKSGSKKQRLSKASTLWRRRTIKERSKFDL